VVNIKQLKVKTLTSFSRTRFRKGEKIMIDKKDYIKGKGLTCPFCGADSIQGGFIQIENGRAFQEMGCPECEGTWQDVYKLVDVIPKESTE
jgi:hypothetical protein